MTCHSLVIYFLWLPKKILKELFCVTCTSSSDIVIKSVVCENNLRLLIYLAPGQKVASISEQLSTLQKKSLVSRAKHAKIAQPLTR